MSGRLLDRIAIVTGAGCVGPGWGNGRATAVRFAEEGARIFAVDRNLDSVAETVERVKAAGAEIVTHQCDVTDNAAVAAMVKACADRFGRIDVLVNNVGGSAHGGPVEMSEEVWDAQVDYNLKSVFLTCKHVLPVMEKQKGGAIVNVASTSGIRFTGAFQVGYAATKAGVIQLSRVVAVQYAAKGIRVNTVVPGQLHTPMVEARLAKQWRPAWPSSAPAATWRPCWHNGLSAFRPASWATAAIPPMPRCSSPPTKRVSSPVRRSWSTAG